MIYYADGTRVGGSDHPTRAFDLAAWLPGCREGDVAASALNPLLWSASAS